MFSKDTFQYSLMHMTFPLFVKSYYSDELPKELLQVCGSVAVILQESVSSTILEMTERVEMLLERAFCKNGSCALIGHSKGGAVISSIARRCMQTTSLAGERSCKHVSKFYSAMGVNLGALGPVIAYGAYRMDHKKARHDTAIAYSQKLTHYLGFLMPIYEKYKPEETNPVWADLGPVSPVDNGMPLALANQVRLEQKGWLTGKYAASGPKHHYTGFLTRDRNFEGCFGVQKSNVLNFSTCYVFNHVLAALHRKDLVKAYFFGLQELKKEEFLVPNDAAADLLDQYSWQDYQHSDGLADYKGALGLCVQGGSAISDCHELPINHLAGAGGSDMARYEILKHLKNG
jgi:hypothetical protein